MSRQQHFLWAFLVFPIRWPHHPTNGGRLGAIFSLEPFISLVIKCNDFFIQKKKKCNDFSKFIGDKCQITNLSDVTDFQKLIRNKCQSSFIFIWSFSSFGPIIHKRREGERMSFPLSIELARKLIFKVVISKDTLSQIQNQDLPQ